MVCVMKGPEVGDPDELRDDQPLPLLGRAEILSADSQPRVLPVRVPEWGGTIYVRTLSGAERDAFENSLTGPRKLTNFRGRLAVLFLCDPNGKSLFTEADVEALAQKSAMALDRVMTAGLNFNAMSQAEVDQLGES